MLITVGTDFLPMALDLGYRVIGLTGTVAWLFYQAVTNERLSQVCMARDGGITQALAHIAVAVRILDKLVKTEDPNDRTESLLAAVLNEQGVLKKAQGDEIGAQSEF